MRRNNLKPGEHGPNNNDRELSSKENSNDPNVISLQARWDVLVGKALLQAHLPPGKLEELLLFKQAEAPGRHDLSWFPLAPLVDSKPVQNVPVARLSCHWCRAKGIEVSHGHTTVKEVVASLGCAVFGLSGIFIRRKMQNFVFSLIFFPHGGETLNFQQSPCGMGFCTQQHWGYP